MRKSYTLIEILVAISIIAILTSTGLGVTSYVRNKIAETQTKTTIKLIEMAFHKYHEKFGYYPAMRSDTRFFMDQVDFTETDTADPEYYKNTLWGYFNDVVADNNAPKIRGIKTEGNNNNCRILDGWGRPIFYLQPGVFNNETYDLISFGGDKLAGNGATEREIDFFDNITKFRSMSPQPQYYPNDLGDDITNFTRN